MDSRKSYLTSISLKQTHLHSLNEMCMLCTHTKQIGRKTERNGIQRTIQARPVTELFLCNFVVLFTLCTPPQMNPTWSDNKVRELIAVKVLHTSLLNTTMLAFKVPPLGSYALMPAPSPPFKTILELVLWKGFRAAVVLRLMSSKCLPFKTSFIFRNRKKSLGARSSEKAGCSNTVICLVAKNSLIDSAM